MKQKITMLSTESATVEERFEQFLLASAAKGLSEKTL